MAEDNRK